MLLSFVFKDSQQQHCLLCNMIIECHVRSDLSLPGARENQIAISSFCPLFHFSAHYFTFRPLFISIIITCYALFLKSDWLVVLMFLLK